MVDAHDAPSKKARGNPALSRRVKPEPFHPPRGCSTKTT
jgi:hypothetical protein